MKREKYLSWLAIALIAVLAVSCQSGGESLADSPPGADLQDSGSGDGSLDTPYHFTMSAEVDGMVADMAYDQLQSEWMGDFTVDAAGLINGEGTVIYDALIFAVDEDLCGYSWAEKGQADYVISGKIHEQGGEQFYPVKFLLHDVERLSLEGPDATCSDPGGSDGIPDMYIGIHRDGLLATVLTHLHQNVGNQIKLGSVIETSSGTVSYQIEVTLAPVPLD